MININNRLIGTGNPVFIVAEMSANHNQDFKRAVEIMETAKEAGADAVKVQTFTPDTITLDCDNEYFRIKGTLWDGLKLHDLYQRAFMPWQWYPELKKIAERLNIILFSTPFDPTAVDFLEFMETPAYKVASSEIVDTGLLKKIAKTGKPVILSTGMATLDEIRSAVEVIQNQGNQQIALLKCTAVYPALPEEMNLRTIAGLKETFGIDIGLSDHTMGIEIPVAAVALGACIIEKHLTLSRHENGVDSDFSLEPKEFKMMIQAIRKVEKAMGQIQYGPVGRETISCKYRRSLFVVKDIPKAEEITTDNIRSIRPGQGLAPKELDRVLGRKVKQELKKGTPLSWEMLY